MLGVGILGAGFFGAFHARAIAAIPEVRIVAVCAEELTLAEAFAAEHGGKPYGDWRAMLDDKSIDAVAITAPHHLHCQLAVAALEAGKHVLLEKPMALSVAECSRIMASAETSRRKLMVGADHALRLALPRGARDPRSRRTRQTRDGVEFAPENLDGVQPPRLAS
jgi:phthalate 4,5-cis-dihydrodiol dehydrogenase